VETKIVFGVTNDTTLVEIQEKAELVASLGYQLIYDDAELCSWCIAKDDEVLWCNYTLKKVVWRLQSRLGIL
jgi:hypothetical protein